MTCGPVPVRCAAFEKTGLGHTVELTQLNVSPFGSPLIFYFKLLTIAIFKNILFTVVLLKFKICDLQICLNVSDRWPPISPNYYSFASCHCTMYILLFHLSLGNFLIHLVLFCLISIIAAYMRSTVTSLSIILLI